MIRAIEITLAAIGAVAVIATVLVWGLCYLGAKEMDRANNPKEGE